MGLGTALAGYGDPVAGVPEPAGRALALWTNAARVDPEAFEADYNAGGCSFYTDFSAAEQVPRAPYRHDADLMAAADAHTLDMHSVGFFSHTSSDGTPFATRVWSYYTGFAIAENIAWDSGSNREMVMGNWMCSAAGHRGAILSATYEDLGAARYGVYGTLDFGARGGASPALRSAAHELAGGQASLYAVIGSASAPDAVELVVDGGVVATDLLWGTDSNGIHGVQVPDDGGCHEYYARAFYGGTELRFPEEGSYGWGACAWDDPGAQWLDRQLLPVAAPTLASTPWAVGASADLTVSGVEPGSTVHFVLGTAEGQGPCPAVLGGLCLQVTGYIRYLGSDVADGSGEAVLSWPVPAAAAGRTVILQAVGDAGVGWALTERVTVDVP